MSDETVITMPDGGRWRPATSVDKLQCHNCDNLVDTPEEAAAYPNGNCPNCNNPWTEKRSTTISVTMPVSLGGGTL